MGMSAKFSKAGRRSSDSAECCWRSAGAVVATAIVVLSGAGCATNGGTQPSAPTSSVQTSGGMTVGGFIDVGGGKTIH